MTLIFYISNKLDFWPIKGLKTPATHFELGKPANGGVRCKP